MSKVTISTSRDNRTTNECEDTHCGTSVVCLQMDKAIFELFFLLKKYLLVGSSSMLWMGQRISESVSQ